MWFALGILNINTTFETSFLKNENFFKKLVCSFLVESTKKKNAIFPYKTAPSESK